MMEGFRRWWGVRSLREKRLLLVMIALFAVVLVWLGIIRPVEDALSKARERHAEAVLRLARVQAQADAVRLLDRAAPGALAGPLAAIVTDAATQAGFAGAQVTSQGEGRVALAIVSARPTAVFAWIGTLESRGILVERLSARANSDPTIAIDATLVARQR
jgi:general secretion pathway protein M